MAGRSSVGPSKSSGSSGVVREQACMEEDRRYYSFGHGSRLTADAAAPMDMEEKLETGVKNGDCLVACMAAALESLHLGHIRPTDMEAAAARLRTDLIAWIKTKWYQPCVLNTSGMCYHEIIWMQHDLGASPEERAQHGQWPQEPKERLERYRSECDQLYFSPAEMVCFSTMMWEMTRTPIMFRTWRCTNQSNKKIGTMLQVAPDPEAFASHNINSQYVIDLEHLGRLDAHSSHYKLLDSGSLVGMIEVVRDMRPVAGQKRSITVIKEEHDEEEQEDSDTKYARQLQEEMDKETQEERESLEAAKKLQAEMDLEEAIAVAEADVEAEASGHADVAEASDGPAGQDDPDDPDDPDFYA